MSSKSPSSDPIDALNAAAVAAMRAGRLTQAGDLLAQALRADPSRPALWLNRAALCRASGDLDGAWTAMEEVLRIQPRNFLALMLRASLLERKGRAREAATAYGDALLHLPPEDKLDEPTRRAVAHAREMNRAYATDLSGHLHMAIPPEADPVDSRRAGKFVDNLLGKRRVYHQEPAGYRYPDQPSIEFWDRAEFPWIAAFEACTDAIVEELAAWERDFDEMLVPYIEYPDTGPLDQWAELNHSRRWSALHLFNFGRRVEENCKRFPKTIEALSLLPQPNTINRSPSAMFSVLAPHTRIPPHHGISNTRLVVHLPLIVPVGCGFRVGNETREWQRGQAWVFDDTIEHEAWNDSDERRVILLCDVWSPRISEGERRIIAGIMAKLDEFNGVEGPPAGSDL